MFVATPSVPALLRRAPNFITVLATAGGQMFFLLSRGL